MDQNSLTGDFTSGSILKKLLTFMGPLLGALLLQAMYSAVDMVVVGQFGTDNGVSGVATGSNVISLVTFVVTSMTMGLTVCISQYIGEKKPERISRVIGAAVFFYICFAIVMTLLLVGLAPLLARLMNAPEEAFDLTVVYIRVCGVGIVFVIAYNMISGIFRGLGDSRLPFLFVLIACIMNLVLDLLLVIVFRLNVAGVAIATTMAQAVSVVLSLMIIRKKKLPFSFSVKDIGPNHELTSFLQIGLPLALQEFLTSMSFLIVFSIVNSLGYNESSGYGIAQKLISFIMLVPSALMQSMSSFVGQNVGAHMEKRTRQALRTGFLLGTAIGAVVFAGIFFFGDTLAMIFTRNTTFARQAHLYLKGYGLETLITSFVFSFIGYFNGHGQSLPVAVQGISAAFLVRVPLAYIISRQPGTSLFYIGLASPAASLYGIVLFSVWYIWYTRRMDKRTSLD